MPKTKPSKQEMREAIASLTSCEFRVSKLSEGQYKGLWTVFAKDSPMPYIPFSADELIAFAAGVKAGVKLMLPHADVRN